MISCQKTIHPLVHQGTHQRQRLLQALIPANLRLDDRSMNDLLAFVGKFSEHVRYWGADNTTQGDWTTFFEKDATVLLAIIAATDVDNLKARYRDKELEYLTALDHESSNPPVDPTIEKESERKLKELIKLIYDAAHEILMVCQKMPDEHPLKKEIGRIIQEKLQQPLRQLIAYHKGTLKNDEELKKLLSDYQDFIGTTPCQQPWGILNNQNFLNIYWDNQYDQMLLWRLFLEFCKVLQTIVALAEKAFHRSLHGRSNHAPHITLLLSFLQLFRYLQNDLNNLTERHLLFYYQEVLLLQSRREIPDRVHLVFEIAQNLDRYLIKKDTAFLDGKDALGLDRLYTLEDELVVNKAKLVEKKNLYITTIKDDIGAEKILTIALPKADKRDGLEEEFGAGLKAWGGLSGRMTHNKLVYKLRKIRDLIETQRELPPSVLIEEAKLDLKIKQLETPPGFILVSPLLRMRESDTRQIKIDINFAGNLIDGRDPRNDFSFQISVDNGTKDIYPNSINRDHPNILYNFLIPPGFGEITNSDTNFSYPYIIIKPKTIVNNYLQNAILNIVLSTQVTGFKKLILQQGNILIEPSGEINLIGTTGSNTIANVYVGVPDLINKGLFNASGDLLLTIGQTATSLPSITKVSILKQGVWKELPRQHTTSLTWGLPINPREDISFNNDIDLVSYVPGVTQGFLKIEFLIPKAVDGIINSYKIDSESISIDYNTKFTAVPAGINSPHQLYSVNAFKGYVEIKNLFFPLVPDIFQPKQDAVLAFSENTDEAPTFAHGNLYLGFENITPSQTLSVLFKMAEGTGNPDKLAPEVVWSYLRQNEWIRFPQHYILKDETLGMKQTGIILFQIPGDINNGNTLIVGEEGRTDLWWLRASATEIPEEDISIEALPLLIDIHPQAGTAVFQNNNNSLEHVEVGLPAGSVAQLRFRDVNVKQITQFYSTFGGRSPEGNDRLAYYRRISERLRHKQRAVTVYDYERLLLEQFPKVAVAKCLPHTKVNSVAAPGQVTLSVIPYPEKMIGSRRFFPNLDAGDLEAMRLYLNRYNSYFVSGWGGSESCCCAHEDEAGDCGCSCCCEVENGLTCINARFEPVRLQVCVRFRKGKDIPFYTKQLNEDLKAFLAPWANDPSKPVTFGMSIHITELLRFLEYLDYVDVIMDIKVKHFPTREAADEQENALPWSRADKIMPFTSRSVLTTYLDVLNEDNPNVIDHVIHVIEDSDACACHYCYSEEEEDLRKKMKDALEGKLMTKAEIEKALKDIVENAKTNNDIIGYDNLKITFIEDNNVKAVTIAFKYQIYENADANLFTNTLPVYELESVKLNIEKHIKSALDGLTYAQLTDKNVKKKALLVLREFFEFKELLTTPIVDRNVKVVLTNQPLVKLNSTKTQKDVNIKVTFNPNRLSTSTIPSEVEISPISKARTIPDSIKGLKGAITQILNNPEKNYSATNLPVTTDFDDLINKYLKKLVDAKEFLGKKTSNPYITSIGAEEAYNVKVPTTLSSGKFEVVMKLAIHENVDGTLAYYEVKDSRKFN